MHRRDLGAAVAGDELKIAVPAQKPAGMVVKIDDARHALDHRRRKQPLVFGGRLRLGPIGLARQVVDCKREIGGHPFEERALLGLKDPEVARVDAQRSAGEPIFADWQRADPVAAVLEELRIALPGTPQLGGLCARHLHARARDGHELPCVGVVPPDPGHGEAALVDQGRAHLLKELVAATRADKRLIYAAERAVKTRHAFELPPRCRRSPNHLAHSPIVAWFHGEPHHKSAPRSHRLGAGSGRPQSTISPPCAKVPPKEHARSWGPPANRAQPRTRPS